MEFDTAVNSRFQEMVNPDLNTNRSRGNDTNENKVSDVDEIEEIRRSSSDENLSDEFAHIWSFINGSLSSHQKSKARETWSIKNETKHNRYINKLHSEPNDECLYGSELTGEIFGNVSSNRPVNRFTLTNRNQSFSDESEDSEIAEADLIQCGDGAPQKPDKYYLNSCYNEQQENSDIIPIFRYSVEYKRRLLSENDYELVNIASNESSYSSSTENSRAVELRDTKCCGRLSTPYPDTFIPRLNLDIGLPTVTEITENKSSKRENESQTLNQNNIQVSPTHTNNWVHNENEPTSSNQIHKDETENVIPLSPRETWRLKKQNNSVNIEVPVLMEYAPEDVTRSARSKSNDIQNITPKSYNSHSHHDLNFKSAATQTPLIAMTSKLVSTHSIQKSEKGTSANLRPLKQLETLKSIVDHPSKIYQSVSSTSESIAESQDKPWVDEYTTEEQRHFIQIKDITEAESLRISMEGDDRGSTAFWRRCLNWLLCK